MRDAELSAYVFAIEYREAPRFLVHITDEQGRFPYTVRGWRNMIRSVEAFTDHVGMPAQTLRVKADIYRTGYGAVNGINVRVTPLS